MASGIHLLEKNPCQGFVWTVIWNLCFCSAPAAENVLDLDLDIDLGQLVGAVVLMDSPVVSGKADAGVSRKLVDLDTPGAVFQDCTYDCQFQNCA